MSERLGPIKRRDFIRKLRGLGFEGPFAGGRHMMMVRGEDALPLPGDREYSPGMHRRLLAEIETILRRKISREEWGEL